MHYTEVVDLKVDKGYLRHVQDLYSDMCITQVQEKGNPLAMKLSWDHSYLDKMCTHETRHEDIHTLIRCMHVSSFIQIRNGDKLQWLCRFYMDWPTCTCARIPKKVA